MLDYLTASLKRLSPEWQKFLRAECGAELSQLSQQLSILAQSQIIYPPAAQIFRALEDCPPQSIKVVIVGQDPYHGEGEANGLAFAVNPTIRQPPSLRNIFKELVLEYNPSQTTFASQLLDSWSAQGVLLLNSSLSVIKDQANSLANIGWHLVTDKIIRHISEVNPGCVFMLWGNFARTKQTLIDPSKHLILAAAHPSPLSAYRGFFGCNHFKLANQFITQHHNQIINWLG